MTPERWRRITDVFHLARARDVGARAAILDEACGGDLTLRGDVEEMLAGDDQAGQFGDRPVHSVAEAPRLEPGAQFGAYRIDALIGAGGMGEVYRAHDLRLDRDVAIKVLSTTVSADADARLLREARSVAALNHPHVCTIYEVGETDGHAYIAMELIEGTSLDRLIPAAGFPLADIVRYGTQIADAIAHAHERGIVHRDLKPGNVMISQSGTAKVLDFGLATALSLSEQSPIDVAASHAATSLMAGTAAYMSPEQALGHSTDERSDVFSFGALLYEMAAGQPAFNGDSPMEVLDAVLHTAPEPIAAQRREVPAELSQLIQKALAKDPAERYQHMSELTADLRALEGAGPRRWTKPGTIAAAAVVIAVLTWIVIAGVREVPDTVAAPRPTDVTAGETRVAVLPFENLTRRADDDWLSSAFSDSVSSRLQSLNSLVLVSRNGIAQAYRDHGLREPDRLAPDTIERLSRTLGIRYYVHGSYQRIGDQVKVVASLVDTKSGLIKTQESVTNTFANLLQLEDGLARRLASSLDSDGIVARSRPRTTSLAAYRAITEARGLYASSRWQAALDASKRAVDLDPEYAEAWALLGKSYARVAAPSSFGGGPLQEYRSLARTAAKRAVELDPSSYEAHVALALAHRESAQYEPWRGAAHKAIALNPRSSEAYALLADSYSETPAWGCPPDGNLELAISSYRKALQIDPGVYTYYSNLSEDVLKASGPEAALQVADESIRLHPTNRAGKRSKVLPLIELGRLDEAERMMREAIDDRGPLVQDHRDLGIIELQRGHLEMAASDFEKAIALRGHSWRPAIARQYVRAGLIAPALDHLEETFRAEPACAQWLLTTKSPYWAAIRSNTQARMLLEKYRERDVRPSNKSSR